MRLRPRLLLVLALPALLASDTASGWWSHVSFLASDELQGRDTGSPGHRKAAAYVAAQFEKSGLSPCGAGGFLQPVPLNSRRIDAAKSALTLRRNTEATSLDLGRNATLGARSRSGTHSAPLVFAGYALSIPSHGYDDFAGLDLKGKVAVYVTGSPSHLPGPIRAHFSSAAERNRALHAAGALGSVSIPNPKTTDVPWARSVLSWNRPTLTIAGGVTADRDLALGASIQPAAAAALFAGTGHSLDQLLDLATAGKPLPHFPLPVTIEARVAAEQSALSSDNVCGLVPGSDPQVRGQHVLLSAHLDHLGISGAVNNDALYNGAMDNASGIATLIETARALVQSGPRPNRSVVFLAVTAEERGLLGSRYFAASPLVPAAGIVANINMDMFLPIHPMRLWMVLGLEESTLRGPIETVARRLNLTVQPDPEPHRNRFIRSDQYSFILKGVPSVALKVGYAPGSPEEKMQKDWIAHRYHAPSDDLTQPVDREAAALFTHALLELAREVANQPDRPRWNDTSFFRRFAQP